MRALRYASNPDGVVLEVRGPDPAPGPGDAVVRLLLAGVGLGDLAGAGRTGGPIVPGHQFVGVVESVRGEPRAPLIGRRVVGSPSIPCGACDLCRSGVPMHCRGRRVPGAGEMNGCLAERFAFPAAALSEVPASIDDDTALLAYPLASALHAAQRVRLDRKSFVTVLGDSVLALLCAQVMTRRNASVRLLGSHDDRLDLCEKWGVRRRRDSEAGRRADQDVVVDCVGDAGSLESALGLIRPRGTVILAHTVGGAVPIGLASMIEHEIELVGTRAASLQEALAMLARPAGDASGVDTTGLVSRRFPMASGVEAWRAARSGEHLRVVVHP